MHLLAGDTGRIDDGDAAVDLGQSPGDVVFLSAADSELAALAAATSSLDRPTFRFANLMRLSHPLSVDLYLEKTLASAKLVVVRMMGGVGYWPYGLDQLRALARRGGPRLVAVPGDDRWDESLEAYSTVPVEDCRLVWRYLVEGGTANYAAATALTAHLLGEGERPPPPAALAHAGCYWPGEGVISLEAAMARLPAGKPIAPLIFYRALIAGGSTAPIDALAAELAGEGIAALPVFVASLKDRESEAFLKAAFAAAPPAIVLNTTAFAVSQIGKANSGTVLDRAGTPVLQVVLAGSSEEAWRESARGLLPRDLTMNVVLPEVDGRILTRAISFKAELPSDPRTEARTTVYRPVADRVAFVASQAAAWIRLGAKPAKERRVAIVLSNYPNRPGRIANGVGLDTPESAVRLARALREAGYDVEGFPGTSGELMALLMEGWAGGERSSAFAEDDDVVGLRPLAALADYRVFFNELPEASRAAVDARWGPPESDPAFIGGGFRLPVRRFGNVVIAIQPSRGYDIDPKATYHDPALVPPHSYLAFYAWLRSGFGTDAIVQLGKHGNLEWLPGKATGLSETCWPEVALGALPVIYPFIVNDPGEGSQAKRRSSAVIVDHLMPAMTRAETYGPLAELETLIDEYYLAAGIDPRRRAWLETEIVALAGRNGLDRDLGISRADGDGALRALDAHLCELKEMQIRDGLHVLGASPRAGERTDTLVAIARVARTGGRPQDQSLHRALVEDLRLAFDPFDCDLAGDWTDPRPEALAGIAGTPWRTGGDTVERLELLAAQLVTRRLSGQCESVGGASDAVLDWIAEELAPALDRSGEGEIAGVLAALNGRFVPPGPSGAPTRGRPDVLPTGRNFYSVDVRAVPTRAAWAIGKAAADALALRYFQDEGEWPRSVAMSAWGTSNMRTGGDDVAEVLALIGAAPTWEPGTGRVTGFKVVPLSELRRPRIDVTLKISGMFRDSFPDQIDLIDSAVRAIADLEEDETANPIAGSARDALAQLTAAGVDPVLARRRAAARIFGARPGAYGAGLQVPIDEGLWETRADLAESFLTWGSFAYGGGRNGEAARGGFAERLKSVDAVLQNQDNREHDILDSDDYYQFQGGLSTTVETLTGVVPRTYHGDHSRPEKPVVRSLGEEIARVVRGRAVNPKWIAGMMRHGYKGAFEIAATVDYLFAYAATTDAVGDHHFDLLHDAYLGNPEVRSFIEECNPPALAEMAAKFREAIDRGLWSPRRNSVYDQLSALIGSHKEAAE